LPTRQFNCPPCIKSKKPSCQIPSWIKPPCDGLLINKSYILLSVSKIGMKCFNCPPKYLCFDASSCHFVSVNDEAIKREPNR
jgi:hypothetical protein